MLEYLKASIVRCPAAIKLHGHIPKKKGRLLRNIVDLVLTPVGVIYGGLLYIRSRHSVEMHGKTAVVAIIKNEAPYIQEWIQYHILKGIDIFYIYDNDSDDNVEKVLKKYIEKKIVVYTKMPGFMRQCDAYNDALNRYGRDCQYMIFLDLDEFVYCEREYLPDVFEEKLKDPYAAALGINWCLFGSSHRKQKPDGLVIENYLYRGTIDCEKNKYIKSVCKPRKTLGFLNPHYSVSMPGCYTVDAEGNMVLGAETEEIRAKEIRINHYFTKSYEEFLAKRNRGKADDITKRNVEEFQIHDVNDIFDDSMLKYADLIRKSEP